MAPVTASSSTAYRHWLKAQGLCPGCKRKYVGVRLFCLECRQKQTASAGAWYRGNRERVLTKRKQGRRRTWSAWRVWSVNRMHGVEGRSRA